jgi:hypothetical protein
VIMYTMYGKTDIDECILLCFSKCEKNIHDRGKTWHVTIIFTKSLTAHLVSSFLRFWRGALPGVWRQSNPGRKQSQAIDLSRHISSP